MWVQECCGGMYIIRRASPKKDGRNWFFVKRYGSCGVITEFRGELRCPARFEGKRVRFRMEVLDDDRT